MAVIGVNGVGAFPVPLHLDAAYRASTFLFDPRGLECLWRPSAVRFSLRRSLALRIGILPRLYACPILFDELRVEL